MVPYWRLPGLGIIIYLLKQSTNDFFSYYDSHRQSVNKLQNVEQLPPDEIKEVTFVTSADFVGTVLLVTHTAVPRTLKYLR